MATNPLIPAMPPAQPNLQSLTHTVNAVRQAAQILAGQQSTQGRPNAPGNTGKETWSEASRVTEVVRIYQANDKTSPNWIDVERINTLIMVNKDTGQTWVWKR